MSFLLKTCDDNKHSIKIKMINFFFKAEDAVEEEIDLEKLLASRKPLELKDPKKTLRGFFEREGKPVVFQHLRLQTDILMKKTEIQGI